MSGFVKIERDLWDHPVFSDFVEASAFSWMVAQAAWKPSRVRYRDKIITLSRGQLAASTRDMAVRFGWSESRVRRFLVRLKNESMIDADSDAGVTVITLCNYSKYQDERRTTDAPSDAGATQERRTGDAQNKKGRTLRKEEKKERGSYEPLSSAAPTTPAEPEPECDLVSEDDPIPPPASPPAGGDPVQDAFDRYNETAETAGLPRAQVLNATRRAALKARLRECGGIGGWAAALEKLAASRHCTGSNDRGWRADLDFLLQPKSFVRLMEGRYDDRVPKGGCGPPRRESHMAGMMAAVDDMAEMLGVL